MVDALSRPDRTLDCRWWRRDVGGKMVRFVVCRKGERHVVAARDEDMLVLQRVAPQIGLAGMVNVVIGDAKPANVEPLTGIASKLAEARTAEQLAKYGLPPPSARIYAEATGKPDSWVEITANERHPGWHVLAGRGRRRRARFGARQNRVDPAAGQRRAVRQLPAGHARRTCSAHWTD